MSVNALKPISVEEIVWEKYCLVYIILANAQKLPLHYTRKIFTFLSP
jgi:hypothetical protein